MADDFMTVAEVAAILKLNRETVRTCIDALRVIRRDSRALR